MYMGVKKLKTPSYFLLVKNFYIVTFWKTTKKFPFNDTLLKELGILQPAKTLIMKLQLLLN